ncbi:unnamed protein product [Linum trigynum]|uniref:Uncharacterized protein n=1 Tax=Linum trigynum TaxID=586398 RepID=A0AAV2FAW4_9ROSI
MSADVVPPAGGKSSSPPPPEVVAGQRRPPTESSSPNTKGHREAQHTKKRAKPTAPNSQVEPEGVHHREETADRRSPPLSPRPTSGRRGRGQLEDFLAARAA